MKFWTSISESFIQNLFKFMEIDGAGREEGDEKEKMLWGKEQTRI